jgi:hypothetical protein
MNIEDEIKKFSEDFTNAYAAYFDEGEAKDIITRTLAIGVVRLFDELMKANPVAPKIEDFGKFFKQEEKELVDAVGEKSWMNEKVYFPTEIMDLVNKWIDSKFTNNKG